MGHPYIVTVKKRYAVATLDKAKRAAVDEVRRATPDDTDDGWLWGYGEAVAAALPENGDTVGPLPDGTVIAVDPLTWDDLDSWEAVTTLEEAAAAFNETRAAFADARPQAPPKPEGTAGV